jgi:alpha-amylase/alpha-mannosidase (GH57 family)
LTIRAFCVHGHFYQPPREDTIVGDIPLEPGAAPYNNWNERIHAQCYKSNAEINNFSHISFNLGPTLVRWMVDYDPGTMAQIVEQSRINFQNNGARNAMAQPYNHTILPLAPYHDKVTEIRWGIEDYSYYFGFLPSGMWLPETAVDTETLKVMAECGIDFTILAPWQANVKRELDVTQAYSIQLDAQEKLKINAFFYHGDISGRISFDPELTSNADTFVSDVLAPQYQSANKRSSDPQLLLVASDGELYGHHQPFRELFLERLVNESLEFNDIELVYPEKWLKLYPPKKTIGIHENTSWSCHHGISRWKETCGCAPHGEWKAPLRHAMDEMAKAIDEEFLAVVGPLMPDPWELRHQYIRVVHKRITLEEFIYELLEEDPGEKMIQKLGLLLRAQYERQRMFTSCGWFFDDFDRIEPRNNLAYAAQAVRLTRKATGKDLEPVAMELLREVQSWRSGVWGSTVFRHHIELMEQYALNNSL